VTGTFAEAVFAGKTRIAQRRERRSADEMRAAEKLDPELLAADQIKRAMGVAKHAYLHTRFYREHYTNAGIAQRDLDEPATFEHLPFLDKHDIRRAQDDLLADTAISRRLLPSTTGGSTGEPLKVYHDRDVPTAALWWRAYRWWGISPSDNVAHIYRESRTHVQEIAHRVEWWPTRHILLNARGMDAESMHAFAKDWRSVKPALLSGYVDGIHEFAQFTLDATVTVPTPRAIAVTASVLHPSKRLFIEATLGAPVFDCYRSAEVPWIAAQCRERVGLHVMSDSRVVEIVGADGRRTAPGVEGEVVVTDLWNTVFPLLRYRMGDQSAIRAERCACGMSLPLMDPVQGRLVDVLRSPGGRVVAGGLSVLFNRWPGAVRQFQLRQLADYSVILRVVPGDAADDAVFAGVASEVSRMLDDSVIVRVERVDRVEHVGGKSRLVISDLS